MSIDFPFVTDQDLTRHTDQFLDRSLPKAQWTHAGHLAAAYDLLTRQPEEQVIQTIPDLIRRYNDATHTPNSDTDGYHHTITLFYVRAIAHHQRRLPPECNFLEGCQLLISGPYGAPDFMLRFYSKECLFTVAARRTWVAPDKALPEFPLF